LLILRLSQIAYRTSHQRPLRLKCANKNFSVCCDKSTSHLRPLWGPTNSSSCPAKCALVLLHGHKEASGTRWARTGFFSTYLAEASR
jgi:hypothetical protein